MDDWKTAFAEEWDAVVLGTGMKECLLSGLLSVAGKKVLHLDRNDYYGGASASLDIHQLFKKFGQEQPPNEAELGKLRDYSIDLVPKFIMAGGQLVKVLIHTGVVRRPPRPRLEDGVRGLSVATAAASALTLVARARVRSTITWSSSQSTARLSSRRGPAKCARCRRRPRTRWRRR